MTKSDAKTMTWPASAALILVLPLWLSGCGSDTKSSTNSVSGGGGGSGFVDARKDEYKPQDAQLIARSNNIPVYSAPDNAQHVMHRRPDEVVEEANGVQAHYYNADESATSERLRLRYAGNRLVGKDILPPDVNSDTTQYGSRPAPAAQKSDAANYIDMREYNPKNASGGSQNRSGPSNPTDNANAAFNNDFNQKLNAR